MTTRDPRNVEYPRITTWAEREGVRARRAVPSDFARACEEAADVETELDGIPAEGPVCEGCLAPGHSPLCPSCTLLRDLPFPY